MTRFLKNPNLAELNPRYQKTSLVRSFKNCQTESGFRNWPETFGLTYWQARPKEANLTSEWNFLYNKVHNEWLNLATNTGLFGLGSHLLLIVWFAIWILKQPGSCGRALLNYAILAAILGVETVNFSAFPPSLPQPIDIYLWEWRLARHCERALATKQSQQDCHSASWRIAMTGSMVVTIFYLLFQISRLYSADLKYNLGRQYYSAGIIGEAINPLYQAVNLVPKRASF